MTDLNKLGKLLIIRLSSLGDILLATPLIRSLKKKYSHLEIDFLLRKEYEHLLLYNPFIHNLILFEKDKNRNKAAAEELKKNNYDLVLDLQHNLRSSMITSAIGAPVKKFNKNTLNKLMLVYLKINNLKDKPPIPGRYAETLTGFEPDDEGLDLFTGDFKPAINKSSDRYIGFAPGAKHFSKRWPLQYFSELGKKLSEDNFRIALFGAKDEMEMCSYLAEEIPSAVNLCSRGSILQAAVNIKECRALVCNDSGLMHVACAVRIPVLVFFGSSVREFGFVPYKNHNFVLENKKLSCRPCSHIGRERCPLIHFKCMRELTPEAAYTKLKELIYS